jgi:hypothetical protein
MLTETRSINLPCQRYPTRRKKHVQSTYHAKNIPQEESGSMFKETRSINLPCQRYPTGRKW